MTPLFAYLLKMFVVSGVLYTYYHLVLRDKRFHAWNRFYLLSAVLLSIVLPLFHIPVHSVTDNDNRLLFEVWRLLGKDGGQTVSVTAAKPTGLTWLALAGAVYGLFVLVQLGVMGIHMYRLRKLKMHSPAAHVQGVTLLTTEDSGTPFSFFRWIFWNRALELDSTEGRRMLTHELTHVREGHSVDKVLMQVLCALFFPILPFHWMRKELQLIHEFVADQRATRDDDTAAYAELLVSQAFQASPYAFANNFFQHPLRRRLAMMTKFSNPRFTYLRKMMFLPIAVTLFGLLAFRVEKDHPILTIRIQQAADKLQNAVTRAVFVTPAPPPPAPVAKPAVKPVVKIAGVVVSPVKDSSRPLQQIVVVGYAAPAKHDTTPRPSVQLLSGRTDSVLFVVNGQVMKDRSILAAINPDKIESINVLKGASATAMYGQAGAHGVVMIQLKSYETDKKIGVEDDNKIFTKVEIEAGFPGGDGEWNEYVRKAITAHMDELTTDAKSGTCEILFIVRKDGSVSDVHALTMENTALARICVDAIARGPRWVPAQQNGRSVTAFRKQKVTFEMPDK